MMPITLSLSRPSLQAANQNGPGSRAVSTVALVSPADLLAEVCVVRPEPPTTTTYRLRIRVFTCTHLCGSTSAASMSSTASGSAAVRVTSYARYSTDMQQARSIAA